MGTYIKRLHDWNDFVEYANSMEDGVPILAALDNEDVFYTNVTTEKANAPLIDIARKSGWIDSGSTMLSFKDCFNVTTEEFNRANVIVPDASAPNGYDVTFKDLEHFDEFQYFTGVSALTRSESGDGSYYGSLYNATKLKSVKLPEGLVKAGDFAFSNLFALSSLTMPSTMKEIGYRCFMGDSDLRKVNLNDGFEIAGRQAFLWSMMHGDRLIIPSSMTYFDDQCFIRDSGNAKYQENLVVPNLTYLGVETFINECGPRTLTVGDALSLIGDGPDFTGDYNDCFWKTLESITIPETNPYFKCIDHIYVYSKDGKYFYGGADYGAAKLQTIEIAEGCEKILAGAFRTIYRTYEQNLLDGCPWINPSDVVYRKVILPSTLTYIGDRAGQYLNNYDLEVRAVVPPQCVHYSFYMGATNIYVPAESVDAYKEADVWKSVKNRIKPIPTE